MIKICKYCLSPAKINYFGIKRRHKGYLKTCGSAECLSKRFLDKSVNARKAWTVRNLFKKCDHCSEKFLMTSNTSRWCSTCVPDKFARNIIRRYGLSAKEYQSLVKSTGGICPICQKRAPTDIDHCHKTNRVRGFICGRCNNILAFLEEQNTLERALTYLRRVNYNSICL